MSLLVGCTGSSAASSQDPRAGDALAYGLAPAPDQGTTFRSDVVLVEGGGASVRSVTADGLTWTLAPTARGLADLEPGRVMFLTDRAVGRVVAIQTTDAGVEVTVGPVDITDVIEDGEFAAEGVPLDDPIVVSQEGAFWADPELQRQAGVGEGEGADVPVEPVLLRSTAKLPRPPAPPAILSEIANARTGSFDLQGSCCGKGTRVGIRYSKNGLVMTGELGLEMDRPTADFSLKISGARLEYAGLNLTGTAGIFAKLHATTAEGKPTNGYSPPLGQDFSFAIPVGTFFGIPLTMVVTQKFTVAVNMAGSAVFDGTAKVKLGTTLGFRYTHGRWYNTSGATLDSAASLSATNALSVGISYAQFDYTVRVTVGFGIANFAAGVYLSLAARLFTAVGAPIGFNIAEGAEDPIEHCRRVDAELWLDYGVGYSIPAVVAEVVNFFLRAFNSRPIEREGGLPHGWVKILSQKDHSSQSGFCV
ncbi:hypothetical protein [Microbacterium sp. No. 7]|uniref:hypothetical protein n=1 Tax=Microbacterium sp. No. 7 TaxID=1714373 RepID=UPI0012E146DC|nr:hypothetical protein [Microbacterium sp. No. 7]